MEHFFQWNKNIYLNIANSSFIYTSINLKYGFVLKYFYLVIENFMCCVCVCLPVCVCVSVQQMYFDCTYPKNFLLVFLQTHQNISFSN